VSRPVIIDQEEEQFPTWNWAIEMCEDRGISASLDDLIGYTFHDNVWAFRPDWDSKGELIDSIEISQTTGGSWDVRRGSYSEYGKNSQILLNIKPKKGQELYGLEAILIVSKLSLSVSGKLQCYFLHNIVVNIVVLECSQGIQGLTTELSVFGIDYDGRLIEKDDNSLATRCLRSLNTRSYV
jgi:hypothetical protein